MPTEKRIRYRSCVQKATRLPDALVDLVMQHTGVLCLWREKAPRLLDLPASTELVFCFTSGHVLTATSVAHVSHALSPASKRLFRGIKPVEIDMVTKGWWKVERGKREGMAYMVDEQLVRFVPDVAPVDLMSNNLWVNDCFWVHEPTAGPLTATIDSETHSWPLEEYIPYLCAEVGGGRILHAKACLDSIEVLMFDVKIPRPVLVHSTGPDTDLYGMAFARGAAAVLQHERRSAQVLVLCTPACGQVDFDLVADFEADAEFDPEDTMEVCLVEVDTLVVVLTRGKARFICPVSRRVLRVYKAAVGSKFLAVFQLAGQPQVVVIEAEQKTRAVRALVFHLETFTKAM